MANNKISAIITTITPEIAEELLKSNTNNYRAIDKRKVEQYAREMEKGLWEANYEAIQIDENGILKNGQASRDCPFRETTGDAGRSRS